MSQEEKPFKYSPETLKLIKETLQTKQCTEYINPAALSIVPSHEMCIFSMKSSETPSKSTCSICNETFDDPHVYFCDYCKHRGISFGICKVCSEKKSMDYDHVRSHKQVK